MLYMVCQQDSFMCGGCSLSVAKHSHTVAAPEQLLSGKLASSTPYACQPCTGQ
jgi:hypothetical protein